MRKDLLDMGVQLDRRPLADADLAVLRRRAERMGRAAATASALKKHEAVIVDHAVRDLYAKYPAKLKQFPLCDEKTRRDMKLVLRYCLYSVLLDDPEYAKDRMFYWFRTILNAFAFGKEFIEDAYRIAQGHIRTHLAAEDSDAMNAMVDEAIAVFNS